MMSKRGERREKGGRGVRGERCGVKREKEEE